MLDLILTVGTSFPVTPLPIDVCEGEHKEQVQNDMEVRDRDVAKLVTCQNSLN